jgi:hypothetical protein
MKRKITRLLAVALAGGMAMMAAATAFGQSGVTLQRVDSDIINGPKMACPAQVNFTGTLQVKVVMPAKAVNVTYQWVRSDGTKTSPATKAFNGGTKTLTYKWTLAKSYKGWAQLVILKPSNQSAKASFALNCSKTGN